MLSKLIPLALSMTMAAYHHTIKQKFEHQSPTMWAEVVPGVKTKLNTQQKIIALTLDACGSTNDGCDYRLINFLIDNNIPATIFVTAQWIMLHPTDFAYLLNYSHLFEIENHGFNHRPCSVNGNAIYGIRGTNNIDELIEEVERGACFIEQLTGRKPHYYRSGTAYYDEIAVAIIQEMGYQVIGFDVVGDAGTTFDQEQTKNAITSANMGSIIIIHMNHPAKNSGQGAVEGIAILKQQGYNFVKLCDASLL